MEPKKLGALTVLAFLGANAALNHVDKHIEQRPAAFESALLMDAIISTLSASVPTTVQFSSIFHK